MPQTSIKRIAYAVKKMQLYLFVSVVQLSQAAFAPVTGQVAPGVHTIRRPKEGDGVLVSVRNAERGRLWFLWTLWMYRSAPGTAGVTICVCQCVCVNMWANVSTSVCAYWNKEACVVHVSNYVCHSECFVMHQCVCQSVCQYMCVTVLMCVSIWTIYDISICVSMDVSHVCNCVNVCVNLSDL